MYTYVNNSLLPVKFEGGGGMVSKTLRRARRFFGGSGRATVTPGTPGANLLTPGGGPNVTPSASSLFATPGTGTPNLARDNPGRVAIRGPSNLNMEDRRILNPSLSSADSIPPLDVQPLNLDASATPARYPTPPGARRQMTGLGDDLSSIGSASPNLTRVQVHSPPTTRRARAPSTSSTDSSVGDSRHAWPPPPMRSATPSGIHWPASSVGSTPASRLNWPSSAGGTPASAGSTPASLPPPNFTPPGLPSAGTPAASSSAGAPSALRTPSAGPTTSTPATGGSRNVHFATPASTTAPAARSSRIPVRTNTSGTPASLPPSYHTPSYARRPPSQRQPQSILRTPSSSSTNPSNLTNNRTTPSSRSSAGNTAYDSQSIGTADDLMDRTSLNSSEGSLGSNTTASTNASGKKKKSKWQKIKKGTKSTANALGKPLKYATLATVGVVGARNLGNESNVTQTVNGETSTSSTTENDQPVESGSGIKRKKEQDEEEMNAKKSKIDTNDDDDFMEDESYDTNDMDGEVEDDDDDEEEIEDEEGGGVASRRARKLATRTARRLKRKNKGSYDLKLAEKQLDAGKPVTGTKDTTKTIKKVASVAVPVGVGVGSAALVGGLAGNNSNTTQNVNLPSTGNMGNAAGATNQVPINRSGGSGIRPYKILMI